MMELPPLKYTLDNVVVGWREEAVSFARTHGYPLIVNSEQRPFHYLIGHEAIKHKWYEGVFDLGMRTLLPIPFDIQTLGFEDSFLKVITGNNTKVLIRFATLHIFDLDNFTNIEAEEQIEDHLVYDIFDITRGARLGVNYTLLLKESFLKSIKFVPSNRIDRSSTGEFKDIIVQSIIPDTDVRNFDFSETIVRLLVERKLKQHQIKSLDGHSLKISHSLRHTNKNNFTFKVAGTIDKRVVFHG